MENKTKILIADPSEEYRHLLAELLISEGEFESGGQYG